MSHAKEVTLNNFNQTLDENNIVILDFWASWCGPCKAFGPIFERSAEKHPDIFFGKINTEVEQHLAASLQIRSIPTVMVFRENILVFSQAGLLAEAQLDELLSQVKKLDMTKIKEEMKKQEQATAHN